MSERFKVTVLKTVVPFWDRGFESHSLRHFEAKMPPISNLHVGGIDVFANLVLTARFNRLNVIFVSVVYRLVIFFI